MGALMAQTQYCVFRLPSLSNDSLMPASGDLGRALHDEGEESQPHEQHGQNQEHIRKRHHDALAMGDGVQLLDGHQLGVAAVGRKALGHVVECFQHRLARLQGGSTPDRATFNRACSVATIALPSSEAQRFAHPVKQ